jgi:16S rRNA (cytidine1402-2'-O)-methyltransferase
VWFEAPHRIAETLAAMAEVLGSDRSAAVCRELTKTYEEVRRGTLTELAAWAAEGVRGEITIVVAGAEPGAAPVVTDPDADPRKAALAAVAAAYGLDRKAVYDAVVAAKKAAAADTPGRSAPPRP